MSGAEHLKDLIGYRMERAFMTLKDAKGLVGIGGSSLSIIRNSYYAMFYAVLAVLATVDKGAKKHSGVISLFNMHFIKTDIFPRELGKMLSNAFDLRQESDYSTDKKPIDMETHLLALNAAGTEEASAHAEEQSALMQEMVSPRINLPGWPTAGVAANRT